MWVVRCKGVVIYMRFFDYIDTIEKPTIDNIRVIYKAVNEKYDDLIDMALEPIVRIIKSGFRIWSV